MACGVPIPTPVYPALVREQKSGGALRRGGGMTRSIENVPVGILIGKEISFLTSNDGRLYTINTITGQIKSATKIDGSKISRPFVYKDSLYVVKENSIIKLN